MTVDPIPSGYRSLTPCLVVSGGADAIVFYEKAFGATVKLRLDGPGGIVLHSELLIGDSLFTLNDELPEYGLRAPGGEGGVSSSLLIYCEDVDALYARAIGAGGEPINEPADQFHGDRTGSLTDPFGHRWVLATHTEDMTQEEMQRRTDEFMAASST